MTHTHTDRRRAWTTAGAVALAAGLLAAGAATAAAQEMPKGPAARDVEAIACAPRGVTAAPAPLATVTGGVEMNHALFGAGDKIVVGDIGAEGLTVGATYYIRRVAKPSVQGTEEEHWLNLHTLGWAKVDEIDGGQAVATIVYSCDATETGDFLAPFEVPTVPTPIADSGQPDFDNAATVLFGTNRRSVAGESGLVVIDRGSDHGIKPGQTLTVFRREEPGGRVQVIGEGVVQLVTPESATIRLTKSMQPVYRGDLAAPHK
jgi:hypothetical protein